MIERKEEFVSALKRMVSEKGPGVYADESLLKASLADYASDAKELQNQRTIFYNTITAYTPGGFLYQEISHIKDFDIEKQKNWMRWLTEADISEEKAAFTIDCFIESLSMESLIDDSILTAAGTKNTPLEHRIKRPDRHSIIKDYSGSAIAIIAVAAVVISAVASFIYFFMLSLQPFR